MKSKELFLANVKKYIRPQTDPVAIKLVFGDEQPPEADGRIILDGVPHEIFANHKEELLKVSMDVPPVYKLAECLQEHGLNVKSTPELADLERQILKVRRSRHAD